MNASLPRIVSLFGIPVLFALSGCNLADYEQRMLKAQIDLKQRDEEFRLLDGPMELLPPPGGEDFDIFYRAPRGINPQSDNSEGPLAGFIYHYPHKTMLALLPGTGGVQPPIPQPGMPGPQPPRQPMPGPLMPGLPGRAGFSDNAAFLDCYAAYRHDRSGGNFLDEFVRQFPSAGATVKKTRHIAPPGYPEFNCETWECTASDGKSTYYFIFPRLPNLALAIVYRIEPGKLGSVQQAIDVSLQTLVVGEDTSRAEEAYQKDRVQRFGR